MIASEHRSIHRKLVLISLLLSVSKTLIWRCSEACNYIKRSLQHVYFPVSFEKFLRAPVLYDTCERLLSHFEQTFADRELIQLTFTCSKSTIRTLWTYFTPFSNVSIVEFERVNISWLCSYLEDYTASKKVFKLCF